MSANFGHREDFYSRQEVADYIGISRMQLSRYEKAFEKIPALGVNKILRLRRSTLHIWIKGLYEKKLVANYRIMRKLGGLVNAYE